MEREAAKMETEEAESESLGRAGWVGFQQCRLQETAGCRGKHPKLREYPR